MLITVSGPPGSGKSTAAEGLAEALDFDHVSGGDIFRTLAMERNLSLAEFGKLAEEDDSIDRNLDERLRTIAKEQTNIVLESRLAGWMAGEFADLRIWLDAPGSVRAERIAKRDGITIDQASKMTSEREASELRRYNAYYDIDFTDRTIYDLSVNTARWGQDEELKLLLLAVELYDSTNDEGKIPIAGVRYQFD